MNFSRRDLRDAEGMEVIYCCFSERDTDVYENLLSSQAQRRTNHRTNLSARAVEKQGEQRWNLLPQ